MRHFLLWGEKLWSVYDVAQSGVVQKSGDLEEESKKISQPIKRDDIFLGAIKIQFNTQTVITHNGNLLNYKEGNMDEYQNASQRSTTFIGKKPHRFSEARIEANVNSSINHSTTNRALTCFERETRYTTTLKSRGDVHLDVLWKYKQLWAIELDLDARGIMYDPKKTLTSNRKKLNCKRQPEIITPLTAPKNIDP